MPDWSYQTIFRPLLLQMEAVRARRWTLRVFGGLGAVPGGALIIRTFGHMESTPLLETTIGDVTLPTPVGLSAAVDPEGRATRALEQIGFGFREVGPIVYGASVRQGNVRRDETEGTLIYEEQLAVWSSEACKAQLRKESGKLPRLFRLQHGRGATVDEAVLHYEQLMKDFAPWASIYSLALLDDNWSITEIADVLKRLLERVQEEGFTQPLMITVPLDESSDRLAQLAQVCDLEQVAGWQIGEYTRTDEGWLVGTGTYEAAIAQIQLLRTISPAHTAIVAGAGVHQPQDALAMIEAGATAIQLHSGLVDAGPGLPKQINEAVLYERLQQQPAVPVASFWRGWGWMCLLGIGMIIGGVLAWIIAATSVLLPYDEDFLGMSAQMIQQLPYPILQFMAHDRITLAGTMISIGVLYFMLGRYGLRHELHWAKTALATSGIIGFSSFFLYLGYGYFDPLHALVAAILLPMFMLAMLGKGGRTLAPQQPNLHNDRSWWLAQWGQLMFVVLGFAFALGGTVIAGIGINGVFVDTDLAYLMCLPEDLMAINERLIALIAHDRAGFGGALISNAAALLGTSLWGIQRGQRWLWWMYLLAGIPGFVAVFGVHLWIGYMTPIHILPVYIAVFLYASGLILLYPYLCGRQSSEIDNDSSTGESIS